MKNLRMLGAASLFALLSVTLFAGCGDPGMGEQTLDGKTCQVQEDCRKDDKQTHLCVRDGKAGADGKKAFVCRANCTKEGKAHQGSCGVAGTNETCKEVQGGSDKKFACIKGSSGSGPGGSNEPECTVTDVTKCKGGAALAGCNEDHSDPKKNKCELRPVKSVVIVDHSEGEGACLKKGSSTEAVSDAGADIAGVALIGTDGTTLAWGRNSGAVEGTTPPSANKAAEYQPATIPDGNAPTLSSPQCVFEGPLHGKTGSFFSLGCGGKLALQFNTTGISKFVQVFEYTSAQCTTAKTPNNNEDKYDVYVCNKEVVATTIDASIADGSVCTKINDTHLYGYNKIEIAR